jgi:hypothetical protein
MIITLCGSARFEAAWHYWNERLTLDGHTVFSLAVFPSVKGSKNWYSDATKLELDAAHIRKIDASEAIFVVVQSLNNTDRYIGESTSREIAYAKTTGKLIFYSDRVGTLRNILDALPVPEDPADNRLTGSYRELDL